MTRARSIDFDGHEWAAHAQDHWLEFAGNPNFPDYLRIVFVAYGRHRANGHARLDRAELTRYLVRKDGTLPDRRTQWHALDRAMQLGYLRPESRALCLVVNSEHVQGGIGDPNQPCTRDHTIRSRTKDVNGERRSPSKDVNGTGRSPSKDVNGERRSTLRPSIYSTAVRQDRNTTPTSRFQQEVEHGEVAS